MTKSTTDKGIYIIRHKKSRKCYVGRDVRLPGRARSHFRGGSPNCPLIHNAIQKHGPEAFDLFVIEIPGADHQMLDAYEQIYIRLFQSQSPGGYNLTAGGSTASKSTEHKRKVAEARRGKPLSAAHKQKPK